MMKFRSYLTVVVCLFVFNSGCSYLKSSPSETVTNLLRYVERGEIEEAAKLYSSDYINKHGGLPKVKSDHAANARQLKEKGGMKSFEVVKEEILGDLADVIVKTTSPDKIEMTTKVKLIKEGGAWKIDDFSEGVK
jgi:hypothetical protein